MSRISLTEHVRDILRKSDTALTKGGIEDQLFQRRYAYADSALVTALQHMQKIGRIHRERINCNECGHIITKYSGKKTT